MTSEPLPTELSQTWRLTAAGCNAQSRLPLPTLAQRVIELATDHANSIGVGYTRLIADGNAWVLSRLSFELSRLPLMHENYTLTTWIESFNRHFSARNFELRSGGNDGEVIGYIRTVWVAINIESRRPADLSFIAGLADTVSERRCPIEPQPKLRMPQGGTAIVCEGTFKATDIDFNRHVNTVRYIDAVLNTVDLEVYDRHQIARFDIAFSHEATFGEQWRATTVEEPELTFTTAITSAADPQRAFCTARMIMN